MLEGMYWNHMTGWGWTMMLSWSLLWIGLLGVAIWAAARWARGGSHTGPPERLPTHTARDLLDERLARGDIDPDEYQQRRRLLEQHPSIGISQK
jgi:putative membrane protein